MFLSLLFSLPFPLSKNKLKIFKKQNKTKETHHLPSPRPGWSKSHGGLGVLLTAGPCCPTSFASYSPDTSLMGVVPTDMGDSRSPCGGTVYLAQEMMDEGSILEDAGHGEIYKSQGFPKSNQTMKHSILLLEKEFNLRKTMMRRS